MIKNRTRKVTNAVLWCICIAVLAGCRSKTTSGEEANSALTPSQKALLSAHKDKQDKE